jgi:superfamily I DNA/RNA helicase
MNHPLSPQQEAVMSWASSGSGHLNLVARAGTGKTTTLIELCSKIGGEVFLGAFNKKIAEEIRTRLEAKGLAHAKASTMHAAGFGAWKRVSPSCEVNESKMYEICKQQRVNYEDISEFCKIVSLAKQFLYTGQEAPAEWEYIWDQYEISMPYSTAKVERAKELLAESVRLNDSLIDFDDMLYAPIISNIKIPTYDWVLVDEAQDTNPSRRELAIRMLNGSGRLVAVGDDRQAIYGFTGADADAMDLIQERLGSAELPLTVTYRCPKRIVRLAQKWVPDIEAAEGNGEGEIRNVEEEDFSILQPGDSDVILCRLTKPLIQLAYQAIQRGRGVKVEGRDIGRGLLKLAQRFKTPKLREIQPRLQNYLVEERDRLQLQNKLTQVQNLEDKCESLSLMISQSLEDGGSTIDHLKKRIEDLFGDTKGSQTLLTLSTIHKAKGREWDHVWLWGRNIYQPFFYALRAYEKGVTWPLRQEDNLCYVAVTRTKQVLTEIICQQPWEK